MEKKEEIYFHQFTIDIEKKTKKNINADAVKAISKEHQRTV